MTHLPTFNLQNWVHSLKIKKLTQKNCHPKFLLANLTNQIAHHSISQKDHQSNKLCKKQ
jgi:hypothetical protein